jgi:hypothetical protein
MVAPVLEIMGSCIHKLSFVIIMCFLFQKLTHEAGEKVAKQVEPYTKIIKSYGYN